MRGLAPRIHAFLCGGSKDVDGTATRACPTCGDKPGHDVERHELNKPGHDEG